MVKQAFKSGDFSMAGGAQINLKCYACMGVTILA